MSTIILKKGTTALSSGAGYLGEPLFKYDLTNNTGELWIGMGKVSGAPSSEASLNSENRMPVKIGAHPTVTLANGIATVAVNTTDSKTITSTSGYAITKLYFDNDGHVTSADAVQLPSAGSAVTWTAPGGDTTSWQSIGTLTIDGTPYTIKAPTGGSSTSTVNNLSASQPTSTDNASLFTLDGDSRTVTFVKNISSSNGTTIQYAVTNDTNDSNNKIVTATVIVNEIIGGTW